jgi:hypothetical protein
LARFCSAKIGLPALNGRQRADERFECDSGHGGYIYVLYKLDELI